MNRLALILILSLPGIAQAQNVTLNSPTTLDPLGRPRGVTDVFVRNADGTIATLGAATGGATETAQAAVLAAQQQASGALTSGTLTREEVRVLAGGGFTASTLIASVSAGNYLSAALTNTSATQSLVMTSRILACNMVGGSTPNEYARYSTVSVLPASPTPTSVTVGNRIFGGPAIPATFAYSMGAGLPTGGVVSASGFLPTNGMRLEIKEPVVVPPGGKLVYSIGGAGGGLAATARCLMTFLGYVQ